MRRLEPAGVIPSRVTGIEAEQVGGAHDLE